MGWLEEKLPDAGKLPPEVSAIIPPLFSCLEDRSGDVRKKGQAVLPLFMAKVGYDTMLKHTGKLKVREGGKKREGREGGESSKIASILQPIEAISVDISLLLSL